MEGYDVMVVVLCCIVLAAIALCYFTWKLRYMIVLRVKDPQTTVVQNLIAQTVNSVMKSGRAGHLGTGSYEPIPRDVMRLQSWEIPESLYHETETDAKPADRAQIKKKVTIRANRISHTKSTGQIFARSGVKGVRSRAKTVINKPTYRTRRYSRIKSIRLSSGRTVPSEVDLTVLPSERFAGTMHPLDRTISGMSYAGSATGSGYSSA